MHKITSPLDGFRSPFGLPVAGGGGEEGPPPDPHRYWRINFTEVNGSDVVSFSELEMFESVSGPNVVTGGTVSAQSYYTGGYEASKAVDGVLQQDDGSTNRWMSSTDGPPWWLKYDFGSGNEKAIESIGIHHREAASSARAPQDFDIQYSDDDSSWTTLWSVTGETGWGDLEYRRFNNPDTEPSYSGSPWGSHSYWRIYVQSNEESDWIGLAEAEFLNHSGGIDLATGGTASSSGVYGGWEPSKAFDDNNTTKWTPGTKYGWLQYQFASPVAIGAISMTAKDDAAPHTAPKDFAVQYSDDGSVWATAWHVSGETGWALSEKRTFTDPAYI